MKTGIFELKKTAKCKIAKLKVLMGSGLLALFPSMLVAETVTNKDLVAACLDPTPPGQNFCYGFIISAANAAQFYRNIVDVEDTYLDICFPEDVSNEEIVKLYMEWAKKNVSLSEAPAFVGVSTSFSSKYSCQN